MLQNVLLLDLPWKLSVCQGNSSKTGMQKTKETQKEKNQEKIIMLNIPLSLTVGALIILV